jgi:hypothetical protein
MISKYKRTLIAISMVALSGLALKEAWYYLTVTAITYGPFEVQVITPEPMENIVLSLTYDVGPTHGGFDDFYHEVRVVESGEWVKFPAGKFHYGGNPSMMLALYHPELLSKAISPFGSSSARKQWDGAGIKFPPVKALLWQGKEIDAHLMRMNDTYVKHFPRLERKKLNKYVGILEQQINSVGDDINERYLSSARYNLEQFKTETQ